jgi:hypothetical protein
MVPMDSFYRTTFYSIIYILFPFSTNHILSCLSSCVDMVSNLDLISTIFALSLFNNYLATSAKRSGDGTINVLVGDVQCPVTST